MTTAIHRQKVVGAEQHLGGGGEVRRVATRLRASSKISRAVSNVRDDHAPILLPPGRRYYWASNRRAAWYGSDEEALERAFKKIVPAKKDSSWERAWPSVFRSVRS